jgi:hypothetical protein
MDILVIISSLLFTLAGETVLFTLIFSMAHTKLHKRICILHLLIHQAQHHHELDNNAAYTV